MGIVINRHACRATERTRRIDAANSLIAAIAAHGRGFFAHDGRITRFELDLRSLPWLIDKYGSKRVYIFGAGRWRGFSEGGTLRRLCEDLRDYIMTGKPISSRHFGPWPQWICDGDLWGYGDEAMEAVRAAAWINPAVSPPTSKNNTHSPAPEPHKVQL